MNCHDALQQLDSARPDGSDWDAPELRDARRHLDNCHGCTTVMAQRHAWDRAFLETAANLAAAPPDGLETKIHASLRSHAPGHQPDVTTIAPEPTSQRNTRHQWLKGLVALVLLIGIGLSWQSRLAETESLTVEQLRNWPDARQFESVDDFEALAALPEWIESQGGPPVPAGWDPAWMRRPARGWPSRNTIAVTAFRVPLARKDSVSGLLLAVPIHDVAQVPTAHHATGSRPRYSRSGRFSTTAWTDNASGTVFVCLVAPGQFERLRRALVPRPV